MTLTELIAKLKELEGKITPAPWKYSHGTTMDHWELWSNVEGDPVWEVQDDSGVEPSTEFLEFITETRNALPLLIKIIEIFHLALEQCAELRGFSVDNIRIGGAGSLEETKLATARKALSDAEELVK